jgi:Glycosyltransferase
MKVVRIVSELDFGGVEQVLAYSLPKLQKVRDLEIEVIVLGKGGRVSKELIAKGVKVQILGFNPRIPNFKLLGILTTLLVELKPDVVHTQGAEANFHGVWAANLSKVSRIIAEEIGIPNHHSFWKWIFRSMYSKAHRLIAISKAVEKEIVGLGEVGEEKVRVIYNPVDYERLEIGEERIEWIESKEFVQRTNLVRGNDAGEDKEKADKSFVFVTTCRLVPIKNLGRLIEAFGGLVRANSDKNLRLRIVGDGPERENLEKEIRDKGLENRVEILGFQEDIWPFLFESDIFILPSLREGSSVSLAEAMTVGLPSIVTQIGGASEILGESQSGFLIDPLDSTSIQSAMQQMLDFSQEERKAMGERAKKEADRFSVENYIQSLMKLYSNSEF